MTTRPLLLGLAVAAAAAARLLPHLPNVTPVVAMALFGGAAFASRRAAFLVPLAAMVVSDAAIAALSGDLTRGFHPVAPFVYSAVAAVTAIGLRLGRRRGVLAVGAASVASSVVFFLVTNLGVWVALSLYPETLAGLGACYAAGVPFFRNALLGDAVFVGLMFGTLALVERRVARLAPAEGPLAPAEVRVR